MPLTQPNEVTTETRLKDLCEHTLCERCNATGGRPEFAHVSAGVCFGCYGVGRRFTARGTVAKHYYAALLTTTADQLRVGDRVWEHGGQDGARWWSVVELDTDGDKLAVRIDGGGHSVHKTYNATDAVKINDKTTALARMRSTAALQASLKRNGEPK